MSYAMCLDNSWDVMCEEEMYDVNGGWGVHVYNTASVTVKVGANFLKWCVSASVAAITGACCEAFLPLALVSRAAYCIAVPIGVGLICAYIADHTITSDVTLGSFTIPFFSVGTSYPRMNIQIGW